MGEYLPLRAISQKLDDSFDPNGKVYFRQTTDDLGSFSLGSDITASYIEATAQGYYFDEVAGELSDSILALRTFSALSSESGPAEININILTTLSKN